jgi:nitrate reductase gamma subunit
MFLLMLFNVWLSGWIMWMSAALFLSSGICGIGILVKRINKHELRSLSNPDDYISNILVTVFQLVSALTLIEPVYLPLYFIITSALLLYFPLGKLKHAVYFFAARYHLGVFYGWRNVWPPKPIKK